MVAWRRCKEGHLRRPRTSSDSEPELAAKSKLKEIKMYLHWELNKFIMVFDH